MPISFNSENHVFHLQTTKQSYLIKLYDEAYLMHLYWGTLLNSDDIGWYCETPYRRRELIENRHVDDVKFSSEYWPFECPVYGTGDFRPPAISILRELEGTRILDLRYEKHEIRKGKPEIEGLPSTYCEEDDEATTLIITLNDSLLKLKVYLFYTVFEQYDMMTRHMKVENVSTETYKIETIMSTSVDFKQGEFEFIQFSGTTLRERCLNKREIGYGLTQVDSTRGISSHQQSPCIAMARKGCTEEVGEVYGFAFVYSGNFVGSAYMDQYKMTRVQMGINPFNFDWELRAGEHFTSPEVLMTYSNQGFNLMSQNYHKIVQERLVRGEWRDKQKPILINTWEASYFNFNEDKILEFAKDAKAQGMELLVLDDGWFGNRNDATSSLGDWYCNKIKLPHGLNYLVNQVNEMGLKFGIWFEPEMISVESDLYRKHPDWCIHVEGRKQTEWRNQLVLDLSREDVCEYIYESVAKILRSCNIEYVKWDHNRRLTELGSCSLPKTRQQELSHRYVLGLYKILDRLTHEFKHVLFENCASGGGRFDLGMFHYFHQGWISDNSDAVSRLKIQYATSMFFPLNVMTAHVSPSPNHQLERLTPMKFRADVAMPFNFGYELNISEATIEDKKQIERQIKVYKEIRAISHTGQFTRLMSPYETKFCAWQVKAQDGKVIYVWWYKSYCEAEEAYFNLKLRNLCPDDYYLCRETKLVVTGNVLMNVGMNLEWENGDYISRRYTFIKM